MTYKSLIFLFIASLIGISCSDNDNDEHKTLTFLEKYNNTVWESNDYDMLLYSRINNDLNFPIELWVYYEDCFINESDLFKEYTILENLDNKFICQFSTIYDGIESIDLITIEVLNDNLILEEKYFEDDVLLETYYLHFQKTSTDVDNLPLCDFYKKTFDLRFIH